MKKQTTLLFAFVIALAIGGMAQANPLHNPNNAYDVDDNGKITPRDFLLVINQLQRQEANDALPLVSTSETFYWDTNSDSRVSPIDALLVVNHLVATPEPSSIITAGLGLTMLVGLAWRRRRQRA